MPAYRHRLLLALILAISSSAFAHSEAKIKSPDMLEEAFKASASEGKLLLVAFLGEGWSLASDKFSKRVLNDETFIRFAEEEIVYFPLIARKSPKLSKFETASLQSLVIFCDVKSYPEFIIYGQDGKELLRHGYKDLSAEEYIDILRALAR